MAILPFLKSKKDQGPEIFAVFPEEIYKSGVTAFRDIIAPAALEINPSSIRLGEKFARTLFSIHPCFLRVQFAEFIGRKGKCSSASLDFQILASGEK